MYIREIHINGFGIFHDVSITGLGRGLNVLFGPNEKGKSTLLAFIRRCLFGFPRGSVSTNPYPALAGGAYGGRLICALDSGDELVAARTEGPRGGRLEALYENCTITNQQELSTLVGNMSANLYGNVYAIGLAELEQIKSLDSDEIRDRLYGAELGLGRASITEIRQQIEGAANALFKQRGSSQVIPAIYHEIENLRSSIRELKAELASYDKYYSERESNTDRLISLDTRIANLTHNHRTMETQKNLYSEFVTYETARDKYDVMPDLDQFHASVIAQLDEHKEVLQDAESEVRQKTIEVDEIENRFEALEVNTDMIANEASINSLSRMSDKYESALNDLPLVKQKRASKEKNIQDRITELGSPLTYQSVKDYKITAAQEEQLESFSVLFSGTKGRKSEMCNKLELHRETSASKAGSYLDGPRSYRLGMLSIVILAVVGLALGMGFDNLWLAGVSTLFGAIAGFFSLLLKWGPPLRTADPLEQKLLATKAEAEDKLTKLETSWSAFLTEIRLPGDMGTSKAKEVLAEISRLQSEIESLEEYDQRIEGMRSTIEGGNTTYSSISHLFAATYLSGNVVSDIPIMLAELGKQKSQLRSQQELTDQLQSGKLELRIAKENTTRAHDELTNFIAEYGADDEPALRTMGDRFEERVRLESEIKQSRHAIQSSVGVGNAFSAFISAMAGQSLDGVSDDLDQVTVAIERLQDERDEINQDIGSLSSKLDDLSSTTELLDLQMQLENRLEQLRRAATDWTRSQIALTMLNAAVAKYEETRQPDVIRSASGVFATVTGGAYTQVRKPLHETELEVLNARSEKRKVSELSRGTVEQLYLAMRMGLIENYEQHAERMPVIIDDVLVNFDDERAILAAQAISAFAENRQVIAMTCHGASRDVLMRVGGTAIEF